MNNNLLYLSLKVIDLIEVCSVRVCFSKYIWVQLGHTLGKKKKKNNFNKLFMRNLKKKKTVKKVFF